MKQLSGQDSLFIYLESDRTPMHVGMLYLFDSFEKPFDFSEFRRFLEERLHLSSIFRQKLVEVPFDLGKPYWVNDDNFDIKNHLFHVDLLGEGTQKKLVQTASDIYAKPLNRDYPLWKLTFITGLAMPNLSSNGFAMLAEVHHAAIDGKSGVEIMASMLSMTKEPFIPKPPRQVFEGEKRPSGVSLVIKSLVNTKEYPKKVRQVVKSTKKKTAHIKEELGKNLFTPSLLEQAPRAFFNDTVSERKTIGAVDISLEEIKTIKNSVAGVTVNDVMLAICGGALRKLMIEKGRLPLKDLVALVPVSIRQETQEGSMGNHVSGMLVRLATGEINPLKRLEKIHQFTKISKIQGAALPADQIMELIPSEIGAAAGRMYMKMGLSKLHRPLFNLVITNVPGPPIPLYFNGFEVKGHYGLGTTMDGLGMMIIIFSYNGNMSLSVTADKEILPDMDTFTNYLRESKVALYEAATQRGLSH